MGAGAEAATVGAHAGMEPEAAAAATAAAAAAAAAVALSIVDEAVLPAAVANEEVEDEEKEAEEVDVEGPQAAAADEGAVPDRVLELALGIYCMVLALRAEICTPLLIGLEGAGADGKGGCI